MKAAPGWKQRARHAVASAKAGEAEAPVLCSWFVVPASAGSDHEQSTGSPSPLWGEGRGEVSIFLNLQSKIQNPKSKIGRVSSNAREYTGMHG